MKRMHPVRHLTVIAMLIVVLFPLLWMFTTSIRRDNAAFSPELFSNQITWQNYKDLLFPKKNLPALYNEIVNAVNIGESYKNMTKDQILALTSSDYSLFNDYFNQTNDLVKNMNSNAKWISKNYLPKAKASAFENAKALSVQDISYLATIDNLLSKRLKTLPHDYVVAGLKESLQEAESNPNYHVFELLNPYFPNLENSYNSFLSSMKNTSPKVNDITKKIKTLLENVKIPAALSLIKAYEDTFKMLSNGSFRYSKWFAPIYLRGINLNTIKLSRILPKKAEKLRNLKAEVFSAIKALLPSENSYLDTIEAAKLHVKGIRDKLIGRFQSSLTNLNSAYSKSESELSISVSETSKSESDMSEDASQVSVFANYIIPTSKSLDDIVKLMKNALKGYKISQNDSGAFIDVSPIIKKTERWLSISSKYAEFSSISENVNKTLKNLRYLQENGKLIASHSNLDTIKNAKEALPLILLKFESGLEQSLIMLQNYDSAAQKILLTSKNISRIRNELKKISVEIIPLQKKVNSINFSISMASLYFKTHLALFEMTKLEKNAKSYGDMSVFLEKLNSYYSNLKNSNFRFLPNIPKPSKYDEFYSVQNLQNTLSLTFEMVKNMKATNEKYSEYIKKLKARTPSYVALKLLNVPFSISEFNTIGNFYQSQYVSKIAPNLGVISRQTSDMMTKGNLKAINGRLNAINNSAFNLVQIWSHKYTPPFLKWILNSIMVAGLAALFTVLISALMAYPFSRMRFLGRKYGLMGLLLIQMFPTMMSMVALYLLLDFIGKFFPPLGLNSLGGLTFLYIGGGIAFDTWLIKGFFDTIPTALEEAAMIDGATRYQTFWKVVVPLSVPILSVVTILAFIGNFGDYILASIVLTDVNKYTFAVGLQTFSTSAYQTNWGMLTASAFLGAIPMLILFLSLQNFIVGGLTQGSVKG